MSVITDLRIPAEAFELGRIVKLPATVTLTLESMIPLGQKAVPFFWVHNDGGQSFVETIRNHPAVEEFQVVESYEDRTLYALEWRVSQDLFFDGLERTGAQLLSATGTERVWEFELRFPDHEQLSAFKTHCENAHIPVEVLRVYNPTQPEAGPHYGLSDPQRQALILAVERGYYSLPRQCSTEELATALDISDQAVTERLRRGIETLVTNALIESTWHSD